MPDLFEIIHKNSNANEIKRLISLRAFLLNEQDCPWVLLDDFEDIEKSIEFIVMNSIDFFLIYNTKNLSKLNLKPIDILMIPKNKRYKFINLIDELLEFHLNYKKLLIDKLRSDPFKDDSLLEFMMSCCNKSKYFLLIQKRHDELNKLLILANFNSNLNYNCSIFSKELKIRNYWKYLWSNLNEHYEKSIISNVIL